MNIFEIFEKWVDLVVAADCGLLGVSFCLFCFFCIFFFLFLFFSVSRKVDCVLAAGGGWLVVRCVGDRSAATQELNSHKSQQTDIIREFPLNIQGTTQDLLLDAGRDVLVYVDQPQHGRTAKGERKILDRPRDGEARVGVLILGLEVVHAGVGEDLVAGQPHMLRLCCAAQLAGVAACLSTHSPGRGRRRATWAPP